LAPAVNLAGLGGTLSRADMATRSANWAIGSKIVISADGATARSSGDADLVDSGVADGIVVGKVAGPVDPNTNTIPLFIDID
jgi:hypothetical protein